MYYIQEIASAVTQHSNNSHRFTSCGQSDLYIHAFIDLFNMLQM